MANGRAGRAGSEKWKNGGHSVEPGSGDGGRWVEYIGENGGRTGDSGGSTDEGKRRRRRRRHPPSGERKGSGGKEGLLSSLLLSSSPPKGPLGRVESVLVKKAALLELENEPPF